MSYLDYEPISETVKITRQGPTATLTFYIPWDEATAFGLAAVGGYRSVFGIPSFFTPLTYANDLLRLYCNDCSIEGLHDANNPVDGDWSFAKVTLTFGILDQPEDNNGGQDPTQVADYSYSLQAEELEIPKANLHLESVGGDAPTDDDIPNPIKIVPKATLTASYPFKPRQDAANWKDYVGKVNAATWKGHDAETVMFLGPRTKRTRTSDGKDAWEYELTFEVRYDGWNKVYKAETATWVDLFPATYDTADFDDLLSAI